MDGSRIRPVARMDGFPSLARDRELERPSRMIDSIRFDSFIRVSQSVELIDDDKE